MMKSNKTIKMPEFKGLVVSSLTYCTHVFYLVNTPVVFCRSFPLVYKHGGYLHLNGSDMTTSVKGSTSLPQSPAQNHNSKIMLWREFALAVLACKADTK